MSKKKNRSVYVAKNGESLFIEQFDFWKRIDWNDDLPPFFVRLNKIKNDRSFVILAASVLEYQVDRFLSACLREPQNLLNDSSFALKIRFLRAFNYIPPQLVNFTALVSNIRNEFAHNLYLDKFSEARKSSKLTGFLKQLDEYWSDFENEMTYYKVEPKTRQKFKDIWSVALEGIRVYEGNIKLFRQETEKPEFIGHLSSLSTNLRLEREKKERERVRKHLLDRLK